VSAFISQFRYLIHYIIICYFRAYRVSNRATVRSNNLGALFRNRRSTDKTDDVMSVAQLLDDNGATSLSRKNDHAEPNRARYFHKYDLRYIDEISP